jgi:membrane protein
LRRERATETTRHPWCVSPGASRTVRARAFARSYVHEVVADRLPGLAAEVAFFAVLSIFPALLLAGGLLGVFGRVAGAGVADRSKGTVTRVLDAVLTDQASGTVESVQHLLAHHHGGLLTTATIGAVVTVSGAFAVVVEALNLAYDTGELRSWWRRRVLGLGMGLATVVVVAVVLATMVLGPLLGGGRALASTVGLGETFMTGWYYLRLPVLLLLLTGWLAALFRYAPNRRTRWRSCLPGAVVTAVLWLVATACFHYYLRLLGDRNPTLGAFGGGAIVMVWVYLLSLVLLAGGELNATLHDRRHLVEGASPAGAGDVG